MERGREYHHLTEVSIQGYMRHVTNPITSRETLLNYILACSDCVGLYLTLPYSAGSPSPTLGTGKLVPVFDNPFDDANKRFSHDIPPHPSFKLQSDGKTPETLLISSKSMIRRQVLPECSMSKLPASGFSILLSASGIASPCFEAFRFTPRPLPGTVNINC